MKYSQLIGCDTNNAIGFSVTLFVSGCGKNPKCKGCHNSVAWDFNYGKPYTQETEDKIAYARQFYNDAVLNYKNKIEMFPSNIVAGMFNFKAEPFFEAEEAAKEVPKVQF